ncbi:DUF5077 domain-containing protein [Paucibacter sp. APW11]|uniref:DUF5077 domain-containing protein n=1 Tax=Roseateles aquae TaxID=3077235 RepID=A0ABU3P9A1_9BURK|nr:DUF5077 domain-containing protein [Paucibacter sp. APW11]MDT8999088.1 DUF5077 domain-containing protein [Paucibacter sp. APW11]
MFYFSTVAALSRTLSQRLSLTLRRSARWAALSLLGACALAQAASSVKLGGNAYITTTAPNGSETVSNSGLSGWTSSSAVISSYVRVAQPGSLTLALRATPASGTISYVRVSVAGSSFTVKLQPNGGAAFPVGTVNIGSAGYLRIDLQGISKNSSQYPAVQGFDLSGSASTGLVYANDASNFYWSRRGPSVHMGYTAPAQTEYFYNELTIPSGADPIGSYFMANGFGEGNFGIQVKSSTERWVLFSVWDPSSGRTTLTRKGPGVVDASFGGEGTGGQSYLVYPWVAGRTYAFINRVRPDGQGNTEYTAWFYPPETGQWRLIASFKRPNTTTWLTGPYSFAENFIDTQGYLGRKMLIGRQWAVNNQGVWTELRDGRFTTDATGNARQRLDYAGGIDAASGKFYLRMGGFFNDTVSAGQNFSRPTATSQPQVQLNLLP